MQNKFPRVLQIATPILAVTWRNAHTQPSLHYNFFYALVALCCDFFCVYILNILFALCPVKWFDRGYDSTIWG